MARRAAKEIIGAGWEAAGRKLQETANQKKEEEDA
jgi:hypothetical protein